MFTRKITLFLIAIIFLNVVTGCEKNNQKTQNNRAPVITNPIEAFSTPINKNVSALDIKPFFNSINELEPLNIEKNDILKILDNNGITEKNFYDVSIFKFFDRTDETIWLSKTAQIRMAFADKDKEFSAKIRMIGFFFQDKESWEKNINIVKQILKKTIPSIENIDTTLNNLEIAARDSPSEEVDKDFENFSVRLVNVDDETFTLAVIKRK